MKSFNPKQNKPVLAFPTVKPRLVCCEKVKISILSKGNESKKNHFFTFEGTKDVHKQKFLQFSFEQNNFFQMLQSINNNSLKMISKKKTRILFWNKF